jgi:dipeptidyl aminopeptidase/acylaminoacyl peptidase
MHLYMTDEKGSKPIDLTPGDGEVEYVVNDHLSGNLLIVSNHGDRDLKRIHKLSKSARQLTTLDLGGKIEAFARPLSNGLAFIQSSSEMTPWPMVSVNGKIMPVATEQKSTTFPKDLRSPSSISITATDGQAVPIQLFLPKNYNPNKKYPATIFIHGGSRRQMLRGFNHGYYYHHAFALNQYFADKGYIVISLNFRSGIGYGLSFREADEYGPTGASEVRDLIGAGLYLKNRSDVDASSISLWGGSYGGYMTAHGLAQASSIFHCGVDIHGVHDWNDCIKLFNPWYDKHEMKEFSDKAIASSPLAFMDTWKSPVLLIHGDDDRNVSFEQSTKLAEQLQKRKIPYEQLILTDEIHSFLLYKSWLKVYESTYNFINKYTSKR